MTTNSTIFAGVELSSGRKPVTLAGLDDALKIVVLEKWDSSEVLARLGQYESSFLAINGSSSRGGQQIQAGLVEELVRAGFHPVSNKSQSRQWLETDAQDCFRALSGHRLFPRRSLEGRLQRSAILYEQGLQLTDPVDMFEEITRYKLIQGILPLENLPSVHELDALAAAYLAWLSINRPGQTVQNGGLILPAPE